MNEQAGLALNILLTNKATFIQNEIFATDKIYFTYFTDMQHQQVGGL
jgi:hypothetical protein